MKNFRRLAVSLLVVLSIGMSSGCTTQESSTGGGGNNSGVTVTNVSLALGASNTNYISGDVFDPTGITLRVTYSDGSSKTITEGFTYDEDPLEVGDTSITITYGGFSVEQEIVVSDAADALIVRFGSGDCTRCYGDGTVIVGGTQINGSIFVEGDDSSLANVIPASDATGGLDGLAIAHVAANVGTWSWDGETFLMTVNNHTEDVEVTVTYDETNGVFVMSDYDFVDYVGQTYVFGGSCSKEQADKYLTEDRTWPVERASK